jgi:hypothetical protein
MPRFRRGASAAGRSGAHRETRHFGSYCCHVVLGWKLSVPGQHLMPNIFHAGVSLTSSSSVLHGLPQCTSTRCQCEPWDPESAGKATLQGNHHLGHAWNLEQTRAPVACPTYVMRCPSAPGESTDAFQGRHCLGDLDFMLCHSLNLENL